MPPSRATLFRSRESKKQAYSPEVDGGRFATEAEMGTQMCDIAQRKGKRVTERVRLTWGWSHPGPGVWIAVRVPVAG
jgi:hypothetical protein